MTFVGGNIVPAKQKEGGKRGGKGKAGICLKD